MRSLFKAVLGFGLVSVPVDLYKALESEEQAVHWVHRACGNRIRYQKYCPVCNRVLDAEAGDIARAVTLPEGEVVILDQPGDGAAPAASHGAASDRTITIMGFHALQEVDPVFYRDAYWLRPAGGAHKAYRLLVEAMREQGRVAVADMRWHGRTQWTVVRPFGATALMLHTMHEPARLRQEGAHFGEGEVTLSDKERRLASLLVQEMTEPFDPQRYPDRQREALWERVRALAPTALKPQAKPAPGAVIDLMEALRASLRKPEAAGSTPPAPRRRRRTP